MRQKEWSLGSDSIRTGKAPLLKRFQETDEIADLPRVQAAPAGNPKAITNGNMLLALSRCMQFAVQPAVQSHRIYRIPNGPRDCDRAASIWTAIASRKFECTGAESGEA
jgi:hypothetical protein